MATEQIAVGHSRREALTQKTAARQISYVPADSLRVGNAQGDTDPITSFVRAVAAFFNNQTPTLNPSQTGQTPTGLVSGVLNAVDPDSPKLTFSVVQVPLHGDVVVNPDGSYAYTPQASYVRTGVSDSFAVTVSDAASGFAIHGLGGLLNLLTLGLVGARGDSSTRTVTVAVSPFNNAPTVSLSKTTNSDGTTSIAVSTVDPDGDSVGTTATLTNGYGTLTATATGYTFTPDANYAHNLSNGGASAPGSDTVTVTANDGHGGVATSSTTVSITPFNAAPKITVTSVSDPAADGAVTITYTTSDPDNTATATPDPLTVKVTGTPSAQSLSLNGDGTLTYLPTEDARKAASTGSTTDVVTLTVTDGHGGSALTTATVTIAPPADTTPTVNITDTDPATGKTTGTIIGGAATSPLTYAVTKTSVYGTATVDTTTGQWSFKPTLVGLVSSWAGNATPTTTFTITVSDGRQATPLAVIVPLSVSQEALTALLQRSGSSPSALAVSSDGTLYVTNSGSNTLSIITGTNTTVVPVGRSPQAVTVGRDGNVWVVNTSDDTVSVLTYNGNPLETIRVGSSPAGIALGADGTAYVTNTGDDTVTVIGPNSSYWGGPYAVSRTIAVGASPIAVAVGPDGRVYVANNADGSISIIDPADGGTTDTLPLGGPHPYGITLGANGVIATTDPTSNSVIVLSPTEQTDVGTVLATTSGATSYASSALGVGLGPTAITIGSDDTIYVLDSAAGEVRAINLQNPSSTAVYQTGADPTGITVGLDGTIYIANGSDNTVSKISTQTASATTLSVGVDTFTVTAGANDTLFFISKYDGALEVLPKATTLGPAYTATGWTYPLSSITGAPIAVGPAGNLYVGSSGYFGDRVTVYDSGGGYVGSAGNFNDFNGGISKLVVDGSGNVYALNNYGLYVHDNSSSTDKWLAPTTNFFASGSSSARISDIAVGPDGNLYALASQYEQQRGDGTVVSLANQLLIFHPGDGYSSSAIALPLDISPSSSPGALTVGSDGQVYIGNGSSTVAIINPETGAESTVDIGRSTLTFAADSNGHVYIGTYDNNGISTITVLNADHTIGAVIPTGIGTTELAVAPDGNVYGANFWSPSVVIVNPNDYSVSTVTPDGYNGQNHGIYGLASGSSGVYAQVYSGSLGNNGALGFTLNSITNSAIPKPLDVGYDLAFTTVNKPVTIAPLENDTSLSGGPLTLTGISTPGHGTATIAGSTITYTPANGFSGSDSLTYTVTDGSLTGVGDIVVYINIDRANEKTNVVGPPPNPLALLQKLASDLYSVAGSFNGALGNDLSELVRTLGHLSVDIQEVKTLARALPDGVDKLVKVEAAADSLSDLITRIPQIAQGHSIKNFLLGLIDVANITTTIVKVGAGPSGIVAGVVLDGALTGLALAINALPE